MNIQQDDPRWEQWADLTQALFEEHPDRMPEAAFRAMVNNLPYDAAEALPVRRSKALVNGKGIEMLVIPRNDAEFGDCWAPAGKVCMPGEPLELTLDRVVRGELGGIEPRHRTIIGVTRIIRPAGRRNGTAFVYKLFYDDAEAEELERITGGKFFPVVPDIIFPQDGRRVQHPEYWRMMNMFFLRREMQFLTSAE